MLSKPPAAITRLRTGNCVRCEPSGRTISIALTCPFASKLRPTTVAYSRTSIPEAPAKAFRWMTCDFCWLVARSSA